MPYFKDFDSWNLVKKKLDDASSVTSIRAGEVRWISCGVNVGSEIDGKGATFTRPALVVHVIGSALALIIPLSTKVKEVSGYQAFEFQGKLNALCIHQARVISQKRMLSRKGRISNSRLTDIKGELRRFFAL